MKIKILLYLTLLSIISSCFLIRNDCGYRSAKTYNFKILKRNGILINRNIAKTTGVYFNKRKDSQNIDRYGFYRFFSNGRYFRGGSSGDFPDEEKLNDLECGSYGYYIVKSDTIILETHNASAGYVFHYYKSNGLEIELIGTKHRKLGAKYNPNDSGVKYTYHKVDLNTKANW